MLCCMETLLMKLSPSAMSFIEVTARSTSDEGSSFSLSVGVGESEATTRVHAARHGRSTRIISLLKAVSSSATRTSTATLSFSNESRVALVGAVDP